MLQEEAILGNSQLLLWLRERGKVLGTDSGHVSQLTGEDNSICRAKDGTQRRGAVPMLGQQKGLLRWMVKASGGMRGYT